MSRVFSPPPRSGKSVGSPRMRILQARLQTRPGDPSSVQFATDRVLGQAMAPQPESSRRFRRPLPPPVIHDDVFFETQPLQVRGPRDPDFSRRSSAAVRKARSPPPPSLRPISTAYHAAYNVVRSLMEGTPVTETDPTVVAQAVVALERERSEAIASGSYAHCREVQEAIERAKALHTEVLKKQNQLCSVLELKVRRVQTQRSLQNIERTIKNREQMLDRRLAHYIDSTKNKQARELQEFVKHWESEPVRRRYNRASGELRNLKKQEQKYCQQRRAKDAEQVSREAARRQKMEVDSAYQAMVKDYRESKQKMAAKHDQELSLVSEVAKRKKEEFSWQADRIKKPWTARLKKLEREEVNSQDADRLWNRQKRFEREFVEPNLKIQPARPVTGRAVFAKPYNLPPLGRV